MGNCFGEPEPPPPRRRPNRPPQGQGQQQRQQQGKNAPNQRPQSPSAPISSGKPKPMGRDEIVLGSSVSERREMDNDTRWKQLLDKTTTNLIDISQNAQPLDGVDAQQRKNEHKSLLEEIKFPSSANTLFKLPVFNLPDNSKLTAAIAAQDTEFMQQCSHELVLALSNMPIENKGDIVVSFDALG